MNIEELLQARAEVLARYKLLPYTGTVEIKEQDDHRYIYVRERIGGRLKSEYVGVYSDILYDRMLSCAREGRELRKTLRRLERQLAALGYACGEISPKLQENLDFARANIKNSIYAQAVLEGVATTFPQTETIIDNGRIAGMTATDVQKVLNLKHAWEFILDADVILCPSDYGVLCRIAKLVNEGFYFDGGQLRSVPVTIGGTDYLPPLPREERVKEELASILTADAQTIETAISLCLWCMKSQLFNDGNKRTGVIFANHYLIAHQGGLLVVPEKEIREFKRMLIRYYEGDEGNIRKFLRQKCWQR